MPDDAQQHFVLPGEVLTQQVGAMMGGMDARLAEGLRMCEKTGDVRATLPGTLKRRGERTVFVSCDRNIYLPREGDQVVGIVEDRGAGDYYKVDAHPSD